MQLTVEKRDGSKEVYLHTKVMGSIAAALGEAGHYEDGLPEHLAEAVTIFLQKQYGCGPVHSDEINSMIEVALCDTGHTEAALALNEHRLKRQILRDRIEVVHLHRAEGFACEDDFLTSPWEKSLMVKSLQHKYEMPTNMARTIAGSVEEKVLRLGTRTVTAALVRELMVCELGNMKKAQSALQEAENMKRTAARQVLISEAKFVEAKLKSIPVAVGSTIM